MWKLYESVYIFMKYFRNMLLNVVDRIEVII